MNNLSENILIVDDILENLQVLAKMLKNKGYKVRKAINGETALLACKSSRPDLILLDIKMPDMDGYEVCQRLKNNPQTQEIPVIFISALDEIFNKVKAFEMGGIDYITKPFQEEEVIARIKNQSIIQRQKKLLQQEIKQRKETEAILYESRALIASILNSSPDGIAAMQAVREPSTGKIGDFRCVVVNPILAEAVGRTVDDLRGKLFLKRFLQRVNSNLFDAFIKVVETGEPLEYDFHYTENNYDNWYQFIAVKLGDGFAINVRDITERKKMELKLQKTTEELSQSNNELKTLNQELETFSYSVSHDLKNPLSGIDGCIYLLLKKYQGKLDKEGQQYLELIKESSQRMEQIINDLMMLSKIKQRQIIFQSVNLSNIVNTITKMLQFKQPERKVEFMITPDLIVEGDERLLTIALENLIGNAWKYSSKQEKTYLEFGSLSLENKVDQTNFLPESLTNKKGIKVYFIRDNGVGFNLEKAQEIFTPFKRLHNDSEFSGTGIGLSIVQRIIQRHGGVIWCDSQVNQGSTFYFTL